MDKHIDTPEFPNSYNKILPQLVLKHNSLSVLVGTPFFIFLVQEYMIGVLCDLMEFQCT